MILTLLKLFCQFKKYDSFNGNSSISDLKYMYFLYYLGDMEKHFACDSQGFPQKNKIIKLYLSSDDLVRSRKSMQQSLTVFLTPRGKPVALYSFQILSTMFRLGEVKSYVNNNLFYSIPLGSGEIVIAFSHWTAWVVLPFFFFFFLKIHPPSLFKRSVIMVFIFYGSDLSFWSLTDVAC